MKIKNQHEIFSGAAKKGRLWLTGIFMMLFASAVQAQYCIKPGATGTPDGYTSVGILTKGEITNTGWPENVPNGHMVLDSEDKGFVITHMTTAQRDALTALDGMLIYNTDANCVQLYRGTSPGVDPSRAGWQCIERGCNDPAVTVTALTCGSAVFAPASATVGVAYSGTLTVPYTGGNGGTYAAQSYTDNGLTFTLPAGTLQNGNGNLVYNVTGTPTVAGNATVNITFDGKNCSRSITVAVQAQSIFTSKAPVYNGNSVINGQGIGYYDLPIILTLPTTDVVTVVYGGRTYMDKNLGAHRVAVQATDPLAYGSHFQWGRGADGHERTVYNGDNPSIARVFNGTIAIQSNSDTPGHGNFIRGYGDWRSPQNGNLWQGVNGINNPCPSGFRVPTISEIALFGNSNDAFSSPLKFSTAGTVDTNGSLNVNNSHSMHWASTTTGGNSRFVYLAFHGNDFNEGGSPRANGYSVRCIQN